MKWTRVSRIYLPETSRFTRGSSSLKTSFERVGSLLLLFSMLLFLSLPILSSGALERSSFYGLFQNQSFVNSVWLSSRIAFLTSILVTTTCFLLIFESRCARLTSKLVSFLSGLSPFIISAGFLALYSDLDSDDPVSSYWALVLLSSLIQFTFQFRFLFAWREAESFTSFHLARSLGAKPFRAFYDFIFPRWRWIIFGVLASSFFFGFSESTVSFLYGGADTVPYSVWLARSQGQYEFKDARAAQALLFFLWCGLVTVQIVSHQRGRS